MASFGIDTMAIQETLRSIEKPFLEFIWGDFKPAVGFSEELGTHPTRDFPFVKLEECVIPLAIYVAILCVGAILIKFDITLLRSDSTILFFMKFFYNFSQIFLCSYMFIEAYTLSKRNGFYFLALSPERCTPFNASLEGPYHKLLWLFYLSKIYDFMDTVFIILANKKRQFSFLHIYHHISIYLVYYVDSNVGYDGDVIYTVFLNAMVHSVMYTYYLICMHTPRDRPPFWKKYLTMFQMIQFLFMNTHAILALYNGCNYPPRITILYLIYIMSLFFLFARFFVTNYFGKKKIKDSHTRNRRHGKKKRN